MGLVSRVCAGLSLMGEEYEGEECVEKGEEEAREDGKSCSDESFLRDLLIKAPKEMNDVIGDRFLVGLW